MEPNLYNKPKEELIEIIKSLSKDKDSLENEKSKLVSKIQEAEYQVKIFKNLLFGKKSEKHLTPEEQEAKVFNEAELFNLPEEEKIE